MESEISSLLTPHLYAVPILDKRVEGHATRSMSWREIGQSRTSWEHCSRVWRGALLPLPRRQAEIPLVRDCRLTQARASPPRPLTLLSPPGLLHAVPTCYAEARAEGVE